MELFPLIADERPQLAQLGGPLYGVGLVGSLFLWGLGLWFLFLAFVSVAIQFTAGRRENSSLPLFNMGFWSFTCELSLALIVEAFRLMDHFRASPYRFSLSLDFWFGRHAQLDVLQVRSLSPW